MTDEANSNREKRYRILKECSFLGNFHGAAFVTVATVNTTVFFVSLTITAISTDGLMYPTYTPVFVPGTISYYLIIVYQWIAGYTVLFSHIGIDCFLYSVFACVVYQTKIMGYRFSRLGHKNEFEAKNRCDYMKQIVELIGLQFENEK